MTLNRTLYLASESASRKKILQTSGINFHTIHHTADESICSLEQPLKAAVIQITELKMNHITLPVGYEGEEIYIITADTLTKDMDGTLHGKPTSRENAKQMLRKFRNGSITGTGFCVERKVWNADNWKTIGRIVDYDEAFNIFDVPEPFLDFYLDNIPFLKVSGGVAIEGFGEQFVKEIRGCYSAIIGLPMYKIREALFSLDFYTK